MAATDAPTPTSADPIVLVVADGGATPTLDRPAAGTRFDAAMASALLAAAEAREGLAAFGERRRPRFREA